MKVIIVGGGITGLTLALSLDEAGIDCEVYEAAVEIKPLGVGINLLPHSVRELFDLGLRAALEQIAIETDALVYMNKLGQEIWREPRGLAAGYNWPQFSIHRGELQMLLLKTVIKRLGARRVHSDHRLINFSQSGRKITCVFAIDNDSNKTQVEGDLMIGADGIHSTVRKLLYPDEGAPIWNGCILWRATTLGKPFLSGRTMIMAGHANQKFVCYPISQRMADEGKSLINWIAEIRFDNRELWNSEDWNRRGRLEDFLPAFAQWKFDALAVPEIICGCDAVYEFPMVDRDPLPQWTFGRLSLVGDAAHPMYPIGSNGASQGILDARCLSFQLATQESVFDALASYEAQRRPATTKVVLANRQNGPERIMQAVEEKAPDGFRHIDEVVSLEEREAIARQYKQIAGFDQDQLNNRSSYSVNGLQETSIPGNPRSTAGPGC